MQSNHTPAPWHVNGQYICYTNAIVGESIFMEHWTFVDGFKKEQEANLHLIAAAPELLQALIGLLPENQDPVFNGEPSVAAVERARMAIAKATQTINNQKS